MPRLDDALLILDDYPPDVAEILRGRRQVLGRAAVDASQFLDGQVPLEEWQQALLEERLTAHHNAPEEARPWKDVIERVQERLRTGR
jgi:putative addiction module component (TIGR02574 family)